MCLYPNRVFYHYAKNSPEERGTIFTSRFTDFMYRYSPMDAWRPGTYNSAQGSISALKASGADVLTEHDDVPCGQCIECRLAYARSWSCRIMNEVEMYPENTCWFVTCTYNDDNLPPAKLIERVNQSTGEYQLAPSPFHSLSLDDHQRFMKRLRKEFGKDTGLKIRFFMSGEYGEKSVRPHFHYILFGVKLDDLVFYKVTDSGDKLYTSKRLSDVWNIGRDGKPREMGFVTIGSVTTNSAGYIARYAIKKRKMIDASFYEDFGLKPEFLCMSRRPGIGKRWFEEHKNEIYKYDSIVLKDYKGVKSVKPPKYYDALLASENMDQLDKIKEHRKWLALHSDQLEEHLNPWRDKEVYAQAKERAYLKRATVVKPRDI